MRLLVKKRSGICEEFNIRAWADLPRSKSEVEIAWRRIENHWEDDDEDEK